MPHIVDQHVGQRFKQARILRRLSQTDVARQVGVSFQQVQKYETGANRISASRLFEFAEILNVQPAFFFEGLYDENNAKREDDVSLNIVKTVAAIEDGAIKDRILTLIEDVTGASAARAA